MLGRLRKYTFTFLTRSGQPDKITNALESEYAVIWYKNDKTGLELWVPFGIDVRTQLTSTDIHYYIPRLVTYNDQSLQLGGCLAFDEHSLNSQHQYAINNPDGYIKWLADNPLNDSSVLFADSDDYHGTIADVHEYLENVA